MSDKEKNIIERLSDTVHVLDEKKQNYLVGLAEGMVIARDSQEKNQSQGA